MIAIRLRKDIYPKDKIADAIAAYDGYAVISIVDDDKYVRLLFKDCRYDEIRTVQEFENYLIGLVNL